VATAQITPDNDAILAEIFIAAPPARVFEAIADPKQRAQWWGVNTPSTQGQHAVVPFRVVDSKSDFRVGGKWSNEGIRGADERFHLEGEYLEIDPPRLLVHTRIADFVGDFTTIVRAGSWSRARFSGFTPPERTKWARVHWCDCATRASLVMWIKRRATMLVGVPRLSG